MVWGDGTGYHQDYDPTAATKQEIYIFCRDCRKAFRVKVKARPRVKVRCTCGHAGRLEELDVFSDKEAAREFAVFYTSIVRDVKNVLRANDLPVPDSGRFTGNGPQVAVQQADEHPRSAEITALRQKALAAEDVVERHELLSELITLTFSCRKLVTGALEQCLDACRVDLSLVPMLVQEGKRRRKAGNPIRLTFTCFKHLSILLEEAGELDQALDVAEQGKSLGLKGYDERIERLRAELGRG